MSIGPALGGILFSVSSAYVISSILVNKDYIPILWQ
jgi:hypothetical protein